MLLDGWNVDEFFAYLNILSIDFLVIDEQELEM